MVVLNSILYWIYWILYAMAQDNVQGTLILAYKIPMLCFGMR